MIQFKKWLFALSTTALALLAAPPPKRGHNQTAPSLPRPEFLRGLGAGYHNLVADFLWLGMLQQIGVADTGPGYRNVYPFADLASDLDPRFSEVYRFAGISIPFNEGREHWVNVEESNAILAKGLVAFPGDFRLSFALATNLMLFTKDYKAAAKLFESMAQDPAAPAYFGALATRLFAQGGAFEDALSLAVSMRASATDSETRRMYERRVFQIQQERLLQEVDLAVLRFRKATGTNRSPTLQELVEQKFLPGFPRDPLKGRIFIDSDGRGRSTSEWYRLQLYDPEEKQAAIRSQGPKANFISDDTADP